MTFLVFHLVITITWVRWSAAETVRMYVVGWCLTWPRAPARRVSVSVTSLMEDMTFVSRQRLCDLDRETVLSTHSGAHHYTMMNCLRICEALCVRCHFSTELQFIEFVLLKHGVCHISSQKVVGLSILSTCIVFELCCLKTLFKICRMFTVLFYNTYSVIEVLSSVKMKMMIMMMMMMMP